MEKLGEAVEKTMEKYLPGIEAGDYESLRKVLSQFIEERGLTQVAVARSIGVSSGTLSLWLTQNYKGTVAKISEAVKNYLEREKERSEQVSVEIKFVYTITAKKIHEVARMCHLDREMGVVYGQAGFGKTYAVKEYARKNSGVVVIETDPGWSARILIQKIDSVLGLQTSGNLDKIMSEVVKALVDTDKLIIIDEAENLPSDVLNLLRRVHDHARIGMLLVGMPKLISNLRGRRGELTQLYSRAGASYAVNPLQPEDTFQIIKACLNGMGEDLSPATLEAFHEKSYGNARILSKLLLRASRIAAVSNVPITPEIVTAAQKMITV